MKLAVIVLLCAVLSVCDGAQHTKSHPKSVGCPDGGKTTNAKVRTLNVKKNRTVIPPSYRTDISLDSLLRPGKDQNRFSDSMRVSFEGYVVYAMLGSVESCNCDSTAPEERDTHIAFSISVTPDSTKYVICEVTPRLRKLMKAKGIDWSQGALADLRGKHVVISGYLLWDWEHLGESQNTRQKGKKVWRATAWEVHPITDIRVVQ